MHDRRAHQHAMEAYLKSSLDALLQERHYEESGAGHHVREAFDCVYESSSDRLYVEAKVLGRQFQSAARGRIADAILRMQHFLRQVPPPPQARGMLAIMVPGLANRSSILEYIDRHAPQLDNFLLDAAGGYELRLRGERESGHVPPLASEPLPPAPARSLPRGRLFAPKFQWLLKVLLLHGFEPKYWGGAKGPPLNVNELAGAAGVSQSYASKFVAVAEGAGYLERSPAGFVVRRIESLLDEWAAAVRFKSQGRRLYAAPMFPLRERSLHESILERLRDQKEADGKPRVVIGGHFACELMHLGRSSVKSAMIYIDGHADEFLSAWDLAEAPKEQQHVEIIEPVAKQSIFDGHGLAQGIPVCDIIQCYLDVRWSAARGQEQADFIYERVLGPRLS